MSGAVCAAPECGRPKKARGLCQMHYLRLFRSLLAHETSRRPPRAERFVVENVAIEADSPLATAGDGLLGAVLRCLDCGQQIGPVRSSVEAGVEIVAHLANDHGIAVRSALCVRQNCGNIRTGGDLCRAHQKQLRQLWRLAERQAAIEAQAQAARDRIATEIAIRGGGLAR